MKYGHFREIKDASRLASFFNKVMGRLDRIRVACAPKSFHPDAEIADFQDTQFCNFIRYELWMHAVVGAAREVERKVGRYFDEFGGSWEYYAASERLAAIREGVADESAGNEPFSIVAVLSDGGLVRETLPEDLKGLQSSILSESQMDVYEGLRRAFGDKVRAFVQDGGKMRPMTMEDNDLMMAGRKADGEADARMVMGICGVMHGIYGLVGKLRWDDDNAEVLGMVGEAARSILAMDFDKLSEIFGKASRMYEEDSDER